MDSRKFIYSATIYFTTFVRRDLRRLLALFDTFDFVRLIRHSTLVGFDLDVRPPTPASQLVAVKRR